MARKSKSRPLKKRRKFGGKNFTKRGGTHRTKTAAKKAAKSYRNKGKNARVSHSKKGWSVYTRG